MWEKNALNQKVSSVELTDTTEGIPNGTQTRMAARRTFTVPPAFTLLLEQAGHTLASASAAASGHARSDLLRDYFRGRKRTLRGDSLERLAIALNAPMDEVAAAMRLEPPAARTISIAPARRRATIVKLETLPLRGHVQAGAWREPDDAAEPRRGGAPISADPRFAAFPQWQEEVVGDVIDELYPPGAYLHAVDAAALGYAPAQEDIVIVERGRAGGLRERTARQVTLGPDGAVTLIARSRNPKWRTPLRPGADPGDGDAVDVIALVVGGYLPLRR